MPVSLPIATVVELGGEKYLPADFLAMFATAEEAFTPPPKRAATVVNTTNQDGAVVEEEVKDETPAFTPDYGPCGVIADWLDENGEPTLASTFRLMVKNKCAPKKSSHKLWSFADNLPKFLNGIRYGYADSFLEAVCKMADELAKVREEMGF